MLLMSSYWLPIVSMHACLEFLNAAARTKILENNNLIQLFRIYCWKQIKPKKQPTKIFFIWSEKKNKIDWCAYYSSTHKWELALILDVVFFFVCFTLNCYCGLRWHTPEYRQSCSALRPTIPIAPSLRRTFNLHVRSCYKISVAVCRVPYRKFSLPGKMATHTAIHGTLIDFIIS